MRFSQTITPTSNFYVNTYTSSLDGKVFYVGKGSKDRYIQHLKEAIRCPMHPTPVVTAICSISRQGGKVIIRKVAKDMGEVQALRLEQKLIDHYRHQGQLVNISATTTKKKLA